MNSAIKRELQQHPHFQTLKPAEKKLYEELLAAKHMPGEFVFNADKPHKSPKSLAPDFKTLEPLQANQKKIMLQAGHSNIQYNSITALRGGTGAPGEAGFAVDVRDRISTLLRARGFFVQGSDANANDDPNITGQDWDLCMALHYDADLYGKGGGMACAPAADVDAVNATSVKIRDAFVSNYFNVAGVVDHQERQNPNTYYYYLWQYMSANTPCLLLEFGVGQHHPDDYDLLQGNRAKAAEAAARSICKYFGVPYDTNPTPTPTPGNLTAREQRIKTQAFATNSVWDRMKKIQAEF